MFCPKCGTQLPDDAIFCASCGTKINSSAAGLTPSSSSSKPLAAFNIGGHNISIATGKMDFVMLISSIAAFISLFLPYLSVSVFGYTESVTLLKGSENSTFILLMILVCLIFSVLGLNRINIVAGYINLLFVAIAALSVSKDKADLGGFGDIVQMGPGFWILLAASIVMAFSWLINKKVFKK